MILESDNVLRLVIVNDEKIIKLCREIKVYYIWLLALIFSILEFLIARGIIKLEENFNTKNISFLLLLILLLSLIGYYLNKKIYI